MVLADWVIIFIIGLNIIDGLRKGFITAFFGLLSVLGSIFAAIYYHKDISALLNKRLLLNQKIKELLAEKLTFLPGTQGLPGITDPPPSNNILEVFKGTWYHFLIKEPGDLILGSLDIITPLADFTDQVRNSLLSVRQSHALSSGHMLQLQWLRQHPWYGLTWISVMTSEYFWPSHQEPI